MLLSGNLAYNSGYFSEPDNVVRQKDLCDGRSSAEWRPIGRGPSVRLWVLNLTDAHYYDSAGDRADGRGSSEPGGARRFGASIGYAF